MNNFEKWSNESMSKEWGEGQISKGCGDEASHGLAQ
jgi:hypothetical protein